MSHFKLALHYRYQNYKCFRRLNADNLQSDNQFNDVTSKGKFINLKKKLKYIN